MLASVACTHCAKKQNSELLSYKKIGKKKRWDHHWISDRINPTSFKVMIAEAQVLARREESQPMHSCKTWGCSGKPWQGLKNDRMPNWFGKSTSEKTPKLQARSPWELCTHAHWSLAHNAKKCEPVSTDTPVYTQWVTVDTCYNMNEPQRHCVKWTKPSHRRTATIWAFLSSKLDSCEI